MSIKLSWTPKPTTESTRIYRGTSLDKLDLKAELASGGFRRDDSLGVPIDIPMVPSSWIDTGQLPLGDHFYAVVVGENGVYSEPAVIKLNLAPAKPTPVTGLKIEVVPDVAPTVSESLLAIDEPVSEAV